MLFGPRYVSLFVYFIFTNIYLYTLAIYNDKTACHKAHNRREGLRLGKRAQMMCCVVWAHWQVSFTSFLFLYTYTYIYISHYNDATACHDASGGEGCTHPI